MNSRLALLAVLTLTLFLSACAPQAGGDPAAAAAAIQAADEQWSAAAGKKDLEATLAFYAADAVLLPPNAPIAKDPKSIRENWVPLLGPNTSISWKVSKVEAANSAELGYVYGTYSLTLPDPQSGSPVSDTGKMVEVWKKQPDGKWKCIVDTFNSDLPPAPAPESKK